MFRALQLLLLAIPAASGCIIYEERYHKSDCEGCTATTETTTPPPPPPPHTTPTSPTGTGPQVTELVELVPNEAYAGDDLLATLVPTSPGAMDLTTVTTLTFERDVAITDAIVRTDEIILLLQIAPDAVPGDLLLFLTTDQGGEYFLAEPFHLLASGATTTDSGTDTGTTTGGTLVNPSTGDTSDTGA